MMSNKEDLEASDPIPKESNEETDQSKDNDEKETKEDVEVVKDDKETLKDKVIIKADFSGTWVLESSGASADDYYKSEGMGFMMRKMLPLLPIKEIIKTEGDNFDYQILVGPGGQFANQKHTTYVLGSGKQFEYKDHSGFMTGVSYWNKDFSEIHSESYRVEDESRTYKDVRALSVLHDTKMVTTRTNKHGKVLIQNFVKLQ
eukprot:31997_1